MHKSLSFFVLLVLLSTQTISAVPSIEEYEKYTIYNYTDNVSRLDITVRWRPYTITIIHGTDGVLLIDTGFAFDGDVIDEAIKKVSAEPIKKIILTHSHPDHAGGVPRFGKEAELYANRKGEYERFFNLEPLPTYPYPVNFIEDSLTFTFNNETIHLYNLPPGHKRDDLYVYLEKANLVITGDLLISGGYPYAQLADEGSYKVILDDFRYFLQRYPDATFVAGHGWDMDKKMLSNYLKSAEESALFIKDKLKMMSVVELLQSGEMAVYDTLADFGVSHELWVDIIAEEEGFIPHGETSILDPLTTCIREDGTERIEPLFYELKKDKEKYLVNEAELNLLGYQLLARQKTEDAEVIFRINTLEFPHSANVFDSYGELMLALGDTTKGIEYYTRAVEVDSTFENAIRVLETLKK